MSKFTLTEDERNALMEQVYGGYQRNPLYSPGNKSTQGAKRPHSDAGKIDYYAYGGKVGYDYNDRQAAHNLEYHIKKKGRGWAQKIHDKSRYSKDWRNRETWSKIAGHLGIDKVDSETDLRQMYDFVRGIGVKDDDDDKPEYKPTPIPEDPYKPHGDPPKGTKRPGGMPKPGDFGTNRPPGSIPYIPPSSDEGRAAYGTAGSGGKTSLDTAIESVADYGNRGTDDYFGRFLPEMGKRNVNEAKATGRSLLSNIQKFTGKVPELGDPKDLFNFYLGKIKD